MSENRPFTAQDLQILEGYRNLADALGRMFGGCCECVLYSLEDREHSVIHVHNGARSGTALGDPLPEKAAALLRQCLEEGCDVAGPCRVLSRRGAPLRTCAVVARGTDGLPAGLLCLHFDLNATLPELCAALGLLNPAPAGDAQPLPEEGLVRNIDEMLLSATCRIRAQVYADDSVPMRSKTREIVLALEREGFFKVRSSVARVADILKVSRDVVYLHLRNSGVRKS